MSPVEPSPVVMGTMGEPSTEAIDDLVFLPNMPAAFNSAGANRPPKAAPSAATKERRLQSNLKFTIFPSQLVKKHYPQGALVSAKEPEEKQQVPFDYAQGRLSTTLRSGRDDNFVAANGPKGGQTN